MARNTETFHNGAHALEDDLMCHAGLTCVEVEVGTARVIDQQGVGFHACIPSSREFHF
ncbi:MAG: hypothetical protein OEM97_01570 [Acidimicrobiia bacterium]|nr:hypothetical protein [Acidimicrobiia bacterium]